MGFWWEGIDQSRLLIAPDPGVNGDGSARLLSLPHQKSGLKAPYLLRNGLFQELHWFKQSYGSWFLGDYVSEDNPFILITSSCAMRLDLLETRKIASDLEVCATAMGRPASSSNFSQGKNTNGKKRKRCSPGLLEGGIEGFVEWIEDQATSIHLVGVQSPVILAITA